MRVRVRVRARAAAAAEIVSREECVLSLGLKKVY